MRTRDPCFLGYPIELSAKRWPPFLCRELRASTCGSQRTCAQELYVAHAEYTLGAFHWGNSGIQRHQLPENRRSFPSVASWCRDSVEARRSRVLPGVQAEIVKDLDEKTREGKTKVE